MPNLCLKLIEQGFSGKLAVNRISAAMRLSFGLASLTLSVLFAAHSLHFIPDTQRYELQSRQALSESVAVQACLACQHDDADSMQAIISNVVARNHSVLSAAVRR